MSTHPIAVFGAGGRAGRAVVAEALRRHHRVTAVVRDPSRHSDLDVRGVDLVRGDLTRPAAVTAAAAVNAVSPFTAPPDSFAGFDPDHFALLARNLVATGVPRIVEIGLAATLRTGSGRLYEDPAAFPAFLRPFAEARMRGLAEWRGQDADWLVLTPPPLLDPAAPSTGAYRLGDDSLSPEDAQKPLSYKDLAVAVLDEIDNPTRRRVQVSVLPATAPTGPRPR